MWLFPGPNRYIDLEGGVFNKLVDIALNAGYGTDGFDALQNDDTNFADPDSDGYDNLNLGFNLSKETQTLGQFALMGSTQGGKSSLIITLTIKNQRLIKPNLTTILLTLTGLKRCSLWPKSRPFLQPRPRYYFWAL